MTQTPLPPSPQDLLILDLIKDKDKELVSKFAESQGRVPRAWQDKVMWYRRFKDGRLMLERHKKIKNTQKVALKKQELEAQKKLARREAKIQRIMDFTAELIINGGNVTQAALKVGNYSSIASAAINGQRMLKKAKEMGFYRLYLEKQGYHIGKMIDVAIEKMEKSKKPDWWDRIMKMSGYEDFMTKDTASKTPVNVNIFNEHKKLMDEYIIEGEIETEEPDDN